jgi:hypothetical protein
VSKISQVEARRLRRRVDELERMERGRRMRYATDYPGGVNIASQNHAATTDFLPAVINTSRQLGHAVVCVADGNQVRYYAIPHPEMKS